MPSIGPLVTLMAFSTAFVLTRTSTSPRDLSHLAFMAGCWEGAGGNGGTIEEQYTNPSTNIMLGTSRYLKEGRAVDFELAVIRSSDSGSVLTPYPRGKMSDPFTEIASGPGHVTWANPAHDFPKRITYRSDGPYALVATIEGDGSTGEKNQEWRMRRVPCPGS